MDTSVNPIYLVGGGKGGVGKSVVALALVDHLQRRGVNTVLVENDTSNPDVMRAVHDEVACASFDLDKAGGWIDFVNYCDGHRDAVVVVSTAALMKQHRDALARCKATIELAEQMTSEQETRYRTALAALNDEALAALTQRAANQIARMAGNRMVGAVAMAAREQRQRLDAAVASFERIMRDTAASAAGAEQAVARRLVRASRAMVVGGLVVMLVAAGIGGLAGWRALSHTERADGRPSARMGYTSSVSPSMNARISRSMDEAASFGSKAIIGAL